MSFVHTSQGSSSNARKTPRTTCNEISRLYSPHMIPPSTSKRPRLPLTVSPRTSSKSAYRPGTHSTLPLWSLSLSSQSSLLLSIWLAPSGALRLDSPDYPLPKRINNSRSIQREPINKKMDGDCDHDPYQTQSFLPEGIITGRISFCPESCSNDARAHSRAAQE